MANPLPYRVECMALPCRAWEPIAAFNVEQIAVRYGRECATGNPGFQYRVTKRGKVIYHWLDREFP